MKVDSAVVEGEDSSQTGRTVRSRLTWPHPSSAFGISGAPKSVAPLIMAALMSEALGALIPTSSRMNSRVSAATPPATAVACEVPEREVYISVPLEWVSDVHESPGEAAASSARPEQTSTPGATKSGLIRPSRLGPLLEKEATVPSVVPVPDAPIARTFFAVPGAVTWFAPCAPLSPTENNGKTSGLSCTKISTERESGVY